MAAWRTFQRGHASLPVGFPTDPGLRWRRSAVLGLGGALGVGMVALLIGSCVGREAGSGLVKESVQLATAAQLPPAPAASADTGVSLLNSALAKVQDAAEELVGSRPGSGLQPQALSDPALRELLPRLGQAEANLISIYRLISQGEHREALAKADQLVREHPNFQLAHLVHGDLLSLQMRPVSKIGDVPDTKARAAQEQLQALREESRRRLMALTERPPEGYVPTQFLTLAPQSRHAIAVDASRSRLYLFENQTPAGSNTSLAAPPRLKLLGDYYISVGLQGIEKQLEGDKRTPLGVYYITSSLNPKSLPDLYGVGALPINYPNPLDVQRGKTGSGIWLHGTPREQFVRAPQASDGCVVLSNPDLERLLDTVQVRTTPVVIAPELHWVQPQAMNEERERFEATLQAWRSAKGQGNLQQLRSFYSSRFQNQGRNLTQWWPKVEGEARAASDAGGIELKDLSLLQWRDSQDTMVVTFGEVALGQARGATKRQYWARENDQWKIFFEGTP